MAILRNWIYFMDKIKRKIHHLNRWKRLLLIPVYCILRLWYLTLRLKMDAETKRLLLSQDRSTCVFYFWHDALFMAPLLRKFRGKRPMYGLMSASKDGAWLEALVHLFKVKAIRGSSTWRGSIALKELERNAHKVCDIIITPDGPKGPRHCCKHGSLKWALEANLHIVCLQISTSKAWSLASWDQFRLPFPFSSIAVKAHPIQQKADISLESFFEQVQANLGDY